MTYNRTYYKTTTLLTFPIPFTYLILSTYSLRTPSNIFWKKAVFIKISRYLHDFIKVATYLSKYILWIILRSDQTQNSTNLNFSLAPVCQPTGKGGWGVLAALCLLCHLQQHRAVGTGRQGGHLSKRFLQNSWPYSNHGGRLCSAHFYLPPRIFRPSSATYSNISINFNLHGPLYLFSASDQKT